ncbi:MAG: hypothetical protein AAGA24_03945 [Pseudomonadota bacterium]
MPTLTHGLNIGHRGDRSKRPAHSKSKTGVLETTFLVLATAGGTLAAMLLEQSFNLFS